MTQETAILPDTDAIVDLAYQLWIARGCPEGSPEVDWFAAEKQLSGEQPTLAELSPLAALSQTR